MLYLEELLDVTLAEEGQTLMGLDFLVETLNLPMEKIEKIFLKAVSEYSERRPMKKTEVFNAFDENYSFLMPEGTTSCRIARYGILGSTIPRFYIPAFSEMNIEYDPSTRICRVWPPVTPLRLTYTQKYIPTKNVLIEKNYDIPYSTSTFETSLDTMFGGNTLKIQRATTVYDPNTDENVPTILSMSPTGEVQKTEDFEEVQEEAILKGSLGTGTVNLKTKEVKLELIDHTASPLFFSYYPKYYVVKELDIGNYVLTKLFASKLLTALASLRAQATQSKLHNLDLTTDQLYERANDLKDEVRQLLKTTWSYGDASPM